MKRFFIGDSLAPTETSKGIRKFVVVLGNGYTSIEDAKNLATAIEQSQARFTRITLCSKDVTEHDLMNCTIEIEPNQQN